MRGNVSWKTILGVIAATLCVLAFFCPLTLTVEPFKVGLFGHEYFMDIPTRFNILTGAEQGDKAATVSFIIEGGVWLVGFILTLIGMINTYKHTFAGSGGMLRIKCSLSFCCRNAIVALGIVNLFHAESSSSSLGIGPAVAFAGYVLAAFVMLTEEWRNPFAVVERVAALALFPVLFYALFRLGQEQNYPFALYRDNLSVAFSGAAIKAETLWMSLLGMTLLYLCLYFACPLFPSSEHDERGFGFFLCGATAVGAFALLYGCERFFLGAQAKALGGTSAIFFYAAAGVIGALLVTGFHASRRFFLDNYRVFVGIFCFLLFGGMVFGVAYFPLKIASANRADVTFTLFEMLGWNEYDSTVMASFFHPTRIVLGAIVGGLFIIGIVRFLIGCIGAIGEDYGERVEHLLRGLGHGGFFLASGLTVLFAFNTADAQGSAVRLGIGGIVFFGCLGGAIVLEFFYHPLADDSWRPFFSLGHLFRVASGALLCFPWFCVEGGQIGLGGPFIRVFHPNGTPFEFNDLWLIGACLAAVGAAAMSYFHLGSLGLGRIHIVGHSVASRRVEQVLIELIPSLLVVGAFAFLAVLYGQQQLSMGLTITAGSSMIANAIGTGFLLLNRIKHEDD